MQSFVGKVSPEVKKKKTNRAGSSPPDESDSLVNADTKLSSSDDNEDSHDEKSKNAQNQMVLNDMSTNGVGTIVHAPKPLNSCNLYSSKKEPSKPVPTIGIYTVQCANCFQWRLIGNKGKYEEIREYITEKLFYCETAREWRPDISCEDPGDLQQDNTRLWAMDKHNIARAPPGWQRLLHLRGEGSSKFADVYYVAPSGKRFRSLVEIQKYLTDNPELAAKTDTSKFSFTTPRPLQEDYVRKRPSGVKSSRALEFNEVSPPGQADPPLEPSSSYIETPVRNSSDQPAKKRTKKSSTQGNIP